MKSAHSDMDGGTLRQRIATMPEDSVLFRSDFPDYHSEFVGSTLTELTNAGVWVELALEKYLD